MKVLDLFSGIGGFSLGLERAGMETVAFCEIEEFPRKVLAKHWPNIPIYEDVRNVTKERLDADGIRPDVICGGFPCQDISVAGNQKGIHAERSGLWGELCRIIGEVQPKYAIVENVTALISGNSGGWFGRVLGDLAEIGYDAEWHCISASELGAHHHRDRIWILAYPCNSTDAAEQNKTGEKGSLQKKRGPAGHPRVFGGTGPNPEVLADTNSERLQRSAQPRIFREGRKGWNKLLAGCFCYFREVSQVKPTICGNLDGVSNYSHRIKGLGNAVVPQIPELIGRAIMAVENN